MTDSDCDRAKITQRIEKAEGTKCMYVLLRRYLKPEERAGITHVNVPEWSMLTLPMILYLDQLYPSTPPWWHTILCFTLFLHQVKWQDNFVDIVQHKYVVIKEDMDVALFDQHVKHFRQTQGTPLIVLPISTFGKCAESETRQAY
eukprot:11075258-Ditylum_brightwellii.AAC.1